MAVRAPNRLPTMPPGRFRFLLLLAAFLLLTAGCGARIKETLVARRIEPWVRGLLEAHSGPAPLRADAGGDGPDAPRL